MRLIVREIAEQAGWTIARLQRAAEMEMMTARRYWYGTRDGKRDGPPLREIDLAVLHRIATAIGVRPTALIADDKMAPALALV